MVAGWIECELLEIKGEQVNAIQEISARKKHEKNMQKLKRR